MGVLLWQFKPNHTLHKGEKTQGWYFMKNINYGTASSKKTFLVMKKILTWSVEMVFTNTGDICAIHELQASCETIVEKR